MSRTEAIRNIIVPTTGPLCYVPPGTIRKHMRLMGKSKLWKLARVPSVRGAVASLWHELEEYSWRNARDAAKCYPSAKLDGHRLTIDLGDTHCAVIGINFELGIVLVEFAGNKAVRRRQCGAGESRKRK